MRRLPRRLFLAWWLLLGFAPAVVAETATRTSAFEYHATTGLLIREIIEPNDSALCLVTTYQYDAYGNRSSATTRNCNGTSSGGVTEAPAPTGDPVFASRTSSTSYAATTANPVAGMFPTSSSNALSHAETKEFDPRFGTIAKLTGPNGLATSWTFDAFGRKVLETRSDGTTTAWTFENCGNCPTFGKYFVTQTTTGAPTRTSYFDALNREIRTEVQGFDGTLIRTDTQYDTLGRVTQVSKPYFAGQTIYWTMFQYDTLGRVTQADEPATTAGATRTATAFIGLINTVTVSNAGAGTNMPAGAVQVRTTSRNSQGQVIQVDDTQGNTVSYQYDPFGNLKQTNAASVITTLGYDLRGRKTQMVDPDMGTWTYAYNALGELIRQTDAKSQVGAMVYDLLGRMTSRTEADLVSTWVYDSCTKGIGKLCQAGANNGYIRTVAYDGQGRVSNLSTTIDAAYSVGYSYDAAGRLDVTTYPTGFAVQNVYSAYGYLLKVQRTNDADATVYWQANTQNAAGQVTGETLGNGLATTRTYDVLFRLSAVQTSNTSGTVHHLAYSFDAIGNVIQRADNVQAVTEAFSYDTLNRLLEASGAGLATRSFTYNELGNMTSKSDVGTYSYPDIASARPHAVSSVDGGGAANSLSVNYSYDANGSLISASGAIYPATGTVSFARGITYTSFNMPATVSQTQGTASYGYTYSYSAEHERMRLETVRPDDTFSSIYLHPAGKGALLYEKEIRQSDGRVEHKHYVNAGAGLVGVFVTKSAYSAGDGPQMRYYHRDQIGSISAITNPTAAVLERFGFEAFGERRYPNGTPQDRASPLIGITTDRGFTAHEHLDELNLIHMNGRIYDPVLGRFMTADPFVQSPGDLQSYNRYSYVLNNPFMYTDPSGYRSLKETVRKFTSSVLEKVGGVKYVGGLMQMGLLTHPLGFGTAYGWSTGDWASVARAHATNAILAASVYAGGVVAQAYSAPILASAQGLAYSGPTLSAVQYIGANAVTASSTSFAVAKVNGASTEEAWKGSVLAARRSAVFTLIDIAAVNMRADTIRDSMSDPNQNHNSTKISGGYRGDRFGAGGCRYPCTYSLFGGVQGDNPGNLLGLEYSPGGLGDFIVEANSGPHDFLSKWQYDTLGNTKDFFRSGVGNVLGWAGSLAVMPLSVPISLGSLIAPYSGVQYSNRYLDY